MSGIKVLRKLQLGGETTAGTAVAADFIWRGIATGLEDTRTKVRPDENVGITSMTTRQYTPMIDAELNMASTEATFEQLPHIFEASLDAATPAQDGAGTGYIYSYPFPTTARAITDIKTYTIEAGDNQQAEEMAYAFVSDFTLSGNAGEAWKVDASWKGREASTTTFTGALSVPAVEEILFSKTKLYVDAVSGTIGTTEVTCTLLSATLNITSGIQARHTASGELYFCVAEDIGLRGTLDLTFLHNATAVAQKALWRADTPALVRLEAEGSALGTPGTTYTYKTLQINAAGVWNTFSDSDGDDNGTNIATATLDLGYDTTAALLGSILMVNELTALP
ncbi:MAG: hypothetical protein GY726_10925 [Proteobacteria bacterium]|nr:hypothetical protein [Pseudomonadota bacterium]